MRRGGSGPDWMMAPENRGSFRIRWTLMETERVSCWMQQSESQNDIPAPALCPKTVT